MFHFLYKTYIVSMDVIVFYMIGTVFFIYYRDSLKWKRPIETVHSISHMWKLTLK